MSLKSIKKNYTILLEEFSKAGAKINESQKKDLDNFVIDIEKTLNEQRDQTILATKKMVEEKLEKEYREVVESILKHQKENSELAGKIQNKVVEINESKKIADAVDLFLDQHVEEVLPKKTIIDYKRIQKLEKIQESLKDLLSVSEADIDKKTAEIKEGLEKKNIELTEKISLYESKMNEQTKTFEKMSNEISQLKAKDFVSTKIKDLPVLESQKMIKKTAGMSFDEVKKNYKTILESVQKEINEEQEVKDDTKNLEEAITEILEGKKKTEASTEKTSDKDVEGTDSNLSADTEEDTGSEDGDEPESVVVSESQMQSWIDTLNRITPKK